jgi:hypothetical protein
VVLPVGQQVRHVRVCWEKQGPLSHNKFCNRVGRIVPKLG